MDACFGNAAAFRLPVERKDLLDVLGDHVLSRMTVRRVHQSKSNDGLKRNRWPHFGTDQGQVGSL